MVFDKGTPIENPTTWYHYWIMGLKKPTVIIHRFKIESEKTNG